MSRAKATGIKPVSARRVNLLREAMAMPDREVWAPRPGSISVTLNRLVTKPESNSRTGWRVDHARRKAQHARVALAIRGIDEMGVPKVVTLTRLAPRECDDDNAIGSLKAVRDAVARAFGVDDGPKGPIRWAYAQRKRRVPGVEIGLEWEAKP